MSYNGYTCEDIVRLLVESRELKIDRALIHYCANTERIAYSYLTGVQGPVVLPLKPLNDILFSTVEQITWYVKAAIMNNLIGQLDANQHKDDRFLARQCGFPGDFAYQLQLDDIDCYWIPIAEERLDAVIKDCLDLRDQYMHEEATEPSVMTKLQRGLDENFIKDLCRTPDYGGWVIEGYNYLLELAGHPSAIIDFDLEFLY